MVQTSGSPLCLLSSLLQTVPLLGVLFPSQDISDDPGKSASLSSTSLKEHFITSHHHGLLLEEGCHCLSSTLLLYPAVWSSCLPQFHPTLELSISQTSALLPPSYLFDIGQLTLFCKFPPATPVFQFTLIAHKHAFALLTQQCLSLHASNWLNALLQLSKEPIDPVKLVATIQRMSTLFKIASLNMSTLTREAT